MSVDQACTPEELARLFHQYPPHPRRLLRVRIARKQASWDETRPKERKLMVAIMRLVISDLAAKLKDNPPSPPASSSYFAKPREAEWGC